jgi:hypothetical protein
MHSMKFFFSFESGKRNVNQDLPGCLYWKNTRDLVCGKTQVFKNVDGRRHSGRYKGLKNQREVMETKKLGVTVGPEKPPCSCPQ